MGAITIEPFKRKALEINGEAYELLATDIEILEMMAEFEASHKALAKKNPAPGEVAEGYAKVARGFDRMLGESALAKIMGTDRLPGHKLVEAFQKVSQEALRLYEEDVRRAYE